MKLDVDLGLLHHIVTTMHLVLLSLAVVPFATCFNLRSFRAAGENLSFNLRGYRAAGDSCPLKSCMENKNDLEAEFQRRVKMDAGPTGMQVTFGKDLFTFSCSVFDMFNTCVEDLDSEELDSCIPVDEQPLARRALSMIDKAVCSKAKRLDKLVPCMNDKSVQKMFFEDLVFTGLQFLGQLEATGALPCQDLKTTYLSTVDRLSDSCDNDGLLAILEMFGELATELRDIIAMGLTQTGLSLNEICFDVIVNATATAKESLSTDYPKGLWGL